MTIKQLIIARVNEIDDQQVLQGIWDLLNADPNLKEIYSTTGAEQQAIKDGVEDLDAGRVYSQEASKKLISKWLEERSSGR